MVDFPCTVSEFARAYEVSAQAVRRAIKLGWLSVDRSVRPMQITAGTMPIGSGEWPAKIEETLGANLLRRGCYGFTSDGVEILVDGRIERVLFVAAPDAVLRVCSQIESLVSK